MIKKIILITVLIFLFNIQISTASEPSKIDLKKAVDIALKNNMDIKSYALDVDISKNQIKAANRLQNPSLQTYWNFGASGKGNPNQLGLSQTVELLKRAPRKKLAKANYEQTLKEFEYHKFELKMDVAEAYIKLVVAKSVLKKYENQQEFLENLLKISNRNDSSTPDLDSIEAKIALNQMITEVNKAKTEERTARLEFNRVINAPEGNYDSSDTELSRSNDVIGINIPDAVTELPPFSKIEEDALKNRYDIQIAKNQIDIAQKQLIVTARQKVPDMEISSGYGYQTIGLSDNNVYKSGAYLEANLVNIPLFYTYKPEIQNAKLELEKANNNYISTINKAKKSVQIAYEKFINAQLNLQCYNDKILKDSEDLFKLFEKTYKTKDVDFATLAAVEESYQDLVVGYANSLSDYYVNWINFLREINSENFVFENL